MEQGQELINIKKIVRRRKWSLIVPFISVVILAAIVCLVLPDKYKSTATILIQSQQIPSSLVPSTITSYAEQRIQTITQEVTARSKILELVKKYDLLPDKRDKLTTEEIVEKIRDSITLEPINAEINKETSSRPVVLTIAFTLSYEDKDPKKAQLVTNEIASYYLEKNLESREKYARRTTKFLEEQLKRVQSRISDLETRIARFRKEHLEELPEYTSLNMQKLEKLNSDISNIDMQIRSLLEQKASVRNKLASLDPYAGSNERVLSPDERLQQARLERAQLLAKYSAKHPLVLAKNREIALLEKQASGDSSLEQLQSRLHELELKLADLKSKYSDKYPQVKATEREIREVKKEIASVESSSGSGSGINIKHATNPAYLALKSDFDKISVSIASLKAERARLEAQLKDVYRKLHAMPEVAKQYNQMETDNENAKIHYRELQQKLLTARVSQGMEEDKLGETFKIVEPAFLPEKPYKPNRLAIMLIGIVLGAGCAVGFAALREFSDTTVRDADTLEKITGAPVLSVISRVETLEEKQRRKRRKMVMAAAAAGAVIMGIIIFHLFVMDLSVFFAKLGRFIEARL